MDHDHSEAVALHRWAVIAEAAADGLTKSQRGALVRAAANRNHAHPDGDQRRYSRNTIDRWISAWRSGGLAALSPTPRADTGVVRAHPQLFAEAAALRLEIPSRSAAQIASILWHRHGVACRSAPSVTSCTVPACTGPPSRPSPRHSAAMRRRAPTSAGSPTCWWGRTCPGRNPTPRCGRSCS